MIKDVYFGIHLRFALPAGAQPTTHLTVAASFCAD